MCIAEQALLFMAGVTITLISAGFIGYTKIKKSKALKNKIEEPKKD